MSTVLDEEQKIETPSDDAYEALIKRLSKQSVDKHFDAYVDIDWHSPEMQIDPTDPRWELLVDEALRDSDWYRSLAPEERARVGLYRAALAMKTGLLFENILKRGLLDYASSLPNNSPEFRYIYHEVIEEAQHSLMFQEFVNRSGFDPPGFSWDIALGGRFVVLLARLFPPLFFLFVLGGEDPIDYTQRQELKEHGDQVHPLLERIMRIHVTEEARHLSFARHYLKHEVPKLDPVRKAILSLAAPLLLGEMAQQMLVPAKEMAGHKVPKQALAATQNPDARQFIKDSVGKVRRLCVQLDLVNPVSKRIWKAVGLWDDKDKRAAGSEKDAPN